MIPIDELLRNNADKTLQSFDYRPLTTHECACGNSIFRLLVIFQDEEIATYFTDMECVNCGSLFKTPQKVN